MGLSLPSNFEDIKYLGPICHICVRDHVEKEFQGKETRINCTRCDKPYCDKHASRIDVQFCEDCVRDFQVVQTQQLYNGVEEILIVDPTGQLPEKIVKIPYKTRFKQIKLLGTDWLFYETAISCMSENQLKAALEWHKAAVSEIEIELTEHKIRKARELAKLPTPKIVPIKKPFDQQKALGKAANLMETFAKMYGADALQQALDLLKNKEAGK